MKSKLSKNEKEILASFEHEEWKSVKNFEHRKSQLKQYAQATVRKDKRVNIRISQRDLQELQRKAVQEGLPYQTFISSILHKYINGNLTEKKAA